MTTIPRNLCRHPGPSQKMWNRTSSAYLALSAAEQSRTATSKEASHLVETPSLALAPCAESQGKGPHMYLQETCWKRDSVEVMENLQSCLYQWTKVNPYIVWRDPTDERIETAIAPRSHSQSRRFDCALVGKDTPWWVSYIQDAASSTMPVKAWHWANEADLWAREPWVQQVQLASKYGNHKSHRNKINMVTCHDAYSLAHKCTWYAS